jgi:hypothetical protein
MFALSPLSIILALCNGNFIYSPFKAATLSVDTTLEKVLLFAALCIASVK